MEVKTALILAAGEGTRMHPLTITKAKPLLPIGGKPSVQWTIDYLEKAGIKEIFLLVGKDEKVIREVLGDEISYIRQEKPEGTARAVGEAEEVINDPFICINGDVVVEDRLFPELIKFYEKTKTTILTAVESQTPEDYGVVETDKDLRILRIHEKPKLPSTSLINAGVYVFTPRIFEFIKKTKKSKRGEYEITDSIIMSEAFAYKYDGFWMDIGKPWDLLIANEFLVGGKTRRIDGKVEDFTVVKGDVIVGEGTIIKSGSYIKGPCIIGKDCKIGPNCYIRPYSAIGDNVHIGNAVEIKNSIIMNGTNIPHLSYVGDSIIGENCNLGAGTNIANLRFDNAEVKLNIRGGMESSGRRKFGCVIGDNVKTGINVSILPGRKIGPNKLINPGTIVDSENI